MNQSGWENREQLGKWLTMKSEAGDEETDRRKVVDELYNLPSGGQETCPREGDNFVFGDQFLNLQHTITKAGAACLLDRVSRGEPWHLLFQVRDLFPAVSPSPPGSNLILPPRHLQAHRC